MLHCFLGLRRSWPCNWCKIKWVVSFGRFFPELSSHPQHWYTNQTRYILGRSAFDGSFWGFILRGQNPLSFNEGFCYFWPQTWVSLDSKHRQSYITTTRNHLHKSRKHVLRLQRNRNKYPVAGVGSFGQGWVVQDTNACRYPCGRLPGIDLPPKRPFQSTK